MIAKSAVAMEGLVDGVSDLQLFVAGLVLVLVGSLVRTAAARRRRRPAVGEVWFAEVPFADGTGSKDRPVLVLAASGRTCTVVRFTSKDRSARRDHRPAPVGVGGLQRDSWVDLRPLRLPRRALRRRIARPDPALVLWYESESARSVA